MSNTPDQLSKRMSENTLWAKDNSKVTLRTTKGSITQTYLLKFTSFLEDKVFCELIDLSNMEIYSSEIKIADLKSFLLKYEIISINELRDKSFDIKKYFQVIFDSNNISFLNAKTNSTQFETNYNSKDLKNKTSLDDSSTDAEYIEMIVRINNLYLTSKLTTSLGSSTMDNITSNEKNCNTLSIKFVPNHLIFSNKISRFESFKKYTTANFRNIITVAMIVLVLGSLIYLHVNQIKLEQEIIELKKELTEINDAFDDQIFSLQEKITIYKKNSGTFTSYLFDFIDKIFQPLVDGFKLAFRRKERIGNDSMNHKIDFNN
jgi:hypothetical protein